MTPEQFVILNFIILLSFAGLFFWGRRGIKPPASLNLTSDSDSKKSESKNSVFPSVGAEETVSEILSQNLKDLNPMFIYNGHTWDAFEVLGVLPGSSIETIRVAFDQVILKSDPSSHDFFKAALTTILSGMKNQGYKFVK